VSLWDRWEGRRGVAGGVGELSCMKSARGKGGGVSPASEDWYAPDGEAGASSGTTSIGTDREAMAGTSLAFVDK
jgi:hypothetical protein